MGHDPNLDERYIPQKFSNDILRNYYNTLLENKI